MMGFQRPGMALQVPTGTVDAAARATLLLLYSGIALAGAPVSGPYSIEAMQTFIAGAVEGETYTAGGSDGETFVAGTSKGQGY